MLVDLVLRVGLIQQGQGVAIANADDSPGEAFGTLAPGQPTSR